VIARFVMADITKSPDYQIDGRVSIALDALDDEEKRAVESAITDRDHFIAITAESRKVRRISKDDPFYALRVPSGLRIIYSKVGDDIVIMALMHQATLDTFGQRKGSKAKKSRTRTARASSHTKRAT
jgi:hypothetical protein